MDHKNWDSSLARLENEHVKTFSQFTAHASQTDFVVLIGNAHVNTGETVGVVYDKFLIFFSKKLSCEIYEEFIEIIRWESSE